MDANRFPVLDSAWAERELVVDRQDHKGAPTVTLTIGGRPGSRLVLEAPVARDLGAYLSQLVEEVAR